MTQTLATRSQSTADERRHITVLFCDLVGSTELVSNADPEDARDTLRQYQAVCRRVVEAHGGFIAQYLGDGVLTYFGYPETSEDAAERAVLCALELVESVAGISMSDGGLAARIGLASGLTVVGNVHDQAADQVAVTGQAVNLASRIQACVGPGCVGMADATYRLVRGRFDCRCIGPCELKGIGRPVQIWIARNRRLIPHRWHPIGAHGQLLGREPELTRLTSLWEEARAGRLHAAIISGEAGMGKSRLIRSLRHKATQGATTIELQCSALHMLTPLYPVTSAVTRVAARTGAGGSSFIAGIASLFGGPDNADAMLLATLLFPRSEGALDIAAMPANLRRELLIDKLVHQILFLAKSRALLIIIEDVHWSDPTTIELVRKLLTTATDEALFVLLSCRAEASKALVADLGIEAIHLKALPDDVQMSIIERTSEGRMPSGTAATIVARSDGNPLHAIEITLSALDQDSGLPTLHSVPESLYDGFAARLDRLGDAKRVAQGASAIGRRFGRKLLAAVSGKPPSALAPTLSRLVTAGILRQVPGAKYEYEFRHSLLQDVAYDTLLKRDRVEVHARIGTAMEAFCADTTAPELIAYHWMAADQPERAFPRLMSAATNALDHGMYVEAKGHLDQAEAMFSKVRDLVPRGLEFDLQLSLGRASYVLNGPAHAQTVAAYSQAQDLVELVEDPERQAILLYGIFSGYHFASRFDLAEEPAQRMLELAEATHSRTQMCLANRMLGYLGFFRGIPKLARAHFGRVLELYRFEDDVPIAARFGADHLTASEGFASVLDAIEGRPEDAVRHARKTLAHAVKTQHPPSIGWAYAAAAYVEYFRRDRAKARLIASEGAKFCKEHRIAAWYAQCRLFEIWGAPDRTAEDVRAIIALAGAGNRLGLPLFRGILADVLLSTGDVEAALEEIDRALAEAAQYGQFVFETHLRLIRCTILRQAKSSTKDEIAAACDAVTAAARRFGSGLPSQKAWRL